MLKLMILSLLFLLLDGAPNAPRCNLHKIFQSPRENYEENVKRLDQHQILERSSFSSEEYQSDKQSLTNSIANANIRLNLQPFCGNPAHPPFPYMIPSFYPPPFYFPPISYPHLGQMHPSFHSYMPFAPFGYFGENLMRNCTWGINGGRTGCTSKKDLKMNDDFVQLLKLKENHSKAICKEINETTTDLVEVDLVEEPTTPTPSTEITTQSTTTNEWMNGDIILTNIETSSCRSCTTNENNLTLSDNLKLIPINIEDKNCSCTFKDEEEDYDPYTMLYNPWFYLSSNYLKTTTKNCTN